MIIGTFEGVPTYEPLYRYDHDNVSDVKMPGIDCVYARTYLYYGTQDAPEVAAKVAIAKLVEEGWTRYPRPSLADLFVRESEQFLEVDSFPAVDLLEGRRGQMSIQAWDWAERVPKRYVTILEIMIEYQWPQRDKC